MKGSLNELYRLLGVSKQAVWQYQKRQDELDRKVSCLLVEVDLLRSEHPGCGLEKMYYTLKPDFIGRDKFISIFMDLGYRVRYKKSFHRTTFPVHSAYKNLIQGLMVRDRNIVWQSDITYFQVNLDYYYVVFIIDVYTKRIMGYCVSNHLRAEANMIALKMAIKNSQGSLNNLIHHSDRGSQYIYTKYIDLLISNGIKISMGAKAQDNAYAERINGTIKNEYLKYWKISDFNQLKIKVKKAVQHYNTKRIHNELPGKMTPRDFDEKILNLDNQRKPTTIIYAEGQHKLQERFNHLNFEIKNNYPTHICPLV
jgi:transposase InsO family protein